MKKTISLCLFLSLVSMVSAQNWFKGSFNDALAQAKAENKLVLIDFFSDG